MPIYSWEFASRARHSGGPGASAPVAGPPVDDQYAWPPPREGIALRSVIAHAVVAAAFLGIFGDTIDLPVSGSSAITSSVLVNGSATTSISGDAPFAVQFDCSATTSSDSSITTLSGGGAFLNIKHDANFGDSSGVTHSTTGLSANVHSGGPIFSKVFEDPGTYTVTITHSHTGTINKVAASITVTVGARTGTNRVVVGGSNDAVVSGLGASWLSSPPSSPDPAKEYLLRRGLSYSVPNGAWVGARYNCVDSSGVVGKSGSGALPIITNGLSIGGQNNAVSNCQVNGNLQYYAGDGSGPNLFHRILAKSPGGSAMGQTNEGDFATGELAFFSEAFFDFGDFTPNGSVGSYGCYFGFFVQGSVIACKTNQVYYHDIRIPHAFKVYVGHCQLPGVSISTARHSLKINGGGTAGQLWDGSSSGTNYVSQYIVVQDNILGSASSTNDWTVEISPQNGAGTSPAEGIADVVFLNNTMYRGPTGSPNDLNAHVKRLLYNGNVGGNVSTVSLIFSVGGSDGAGSPSSGGPWGSPNLTARV